MAIYNGAMAKEVEIMYCPKQASSRMAKPEWRV